jgi:sensor histidine kinase YesM
MKKRINRKLFKFYLWVGLVFLLLTLLHDLANQRETFPERALNNIWRVGYVIVLNYILFEYALPFIRRKRKSLVYNILLALVALWLLLVLCSFGLYAWNYIGIQLHIYNELTIFTSIKEGVSHDAEYGVSSIFFFGIIGHIYNYTKLQQATQQLRIEKQQAELNYLKSQTNPHFLFNTLNNIYSLARDKSSLAPESILRLSKILRYMLYETSD